MGFAADTPGEAFDPLASAVNVWRSKISARSDLPGWEDFAAVDFGSWWFQLSLAEMRRDPVDIQWIIWGRSLALWWGHDYTDQFISKQPYLGDIWERVERPYLERLMDERLIGFITGTLKPQDREFTYVDGVDMPLARDGEITHLLSIYRLREPDDDFRPTAPAIFSM